ncbi:uncharacterized protein LOC142163023 [Nicotiana tabacum]|uniref:Uncharacterized protein LOC142163023 n=1 Tax=Nicotiana tabacum TaxID=4097 RepID=A0AC58RUJ1_TOBAC
MSVPPENWKGQSTGENYELWDIVTDSLLATLKKNVEGVDVPKTRADYTTEDLRTWKNNANTKKWLVCGLDPNEYSRIQGCTTAKKIWNTLQVDHEGTPQVKRSRGTLLYSQYESLAIKEGETIQEMYTRFTTLTNELKSIGRIIPEEERLSKLILKLIDEYEDVNNEKEQMSKECVVLKAKCKNLEHKASETESENAGLKNQIRILKEDLSKVKNELDRTCEWNRSSDTLSWLHEHYSSKMKGLGFGNPTSKWDPNSKYIALTENKICTHCGKTGHYKSECTAKEKAIQKNQKFVQGKNRLPSWV